MTEQPKKKEEISSENNDNQVSDNNISNSEESPEEKEFESKNENKTINNSVNNIDFSSINYKDFEKINQEQIDLYYKLNDNKNNIEFLNEDLVVMSKKEEEIKALKAKEKEEFDFQMEELVNTGDEIKVDLTGIIDDIEEQKNKSWT